MIRRQGCKLVFARLPGASIVCLMASIGLAGAGAWGSGGAGASASVEAAAPPVSESPVHAWNDRLEGLNPNRPIDYFLLAEEISDSRPTGPMLQIARDLCVLAFTLWRSDAAHRQSDPTLGASALLLLAWLAGDPGQERWLIALAAGFDPQGLVRTPALSAVGAAAATDPGAVVLDLIEALELLRGGDGRRALRLLNKPEVFGLLLKHERLLSPAGLTGEADRLKRLAGEWPVCQECRNRRAVKGSEGIRLCPTCAGDPGPPLSAIDVYYQLRLEAVLLEGSQSSWVAQTLVDQGRPLRDLDPEEIAPTFGVDPGKPVWRKLTWTGDRNSPPDGTGN